MATIIAQPRHKYEPSKTPIPRLKQENLKSVEFKETDMNYFKGQKNCVGVLMENSGLVPWLQSAFASVLKMMSGKKFPMNIRALRFAVMELLKGFIDDVYSYEDLEKRMEYLAQKSMIAEHWINNLIRAVFLMMLFVRAEREGEFPLHLYACRQMIPYFFAAGHVNYTRYGLRYLLSVSKVATNNPRTVFERRACSAP